MPTDIATRFVMGAPGTCDTCRHWRPRDPDVPADTPDGRRECTLSAFDGDHAGCRLTAPDHSCPQHAWDVQVQVLNEADIALATLHGQLARQALADSEWDVPDIHPARNTTLRLP